MDLRPQIVGVPLDAGLHANMLPERNDYEGLCEYPSRGVFHLAGPRPAPLVSRAKPRRDPGTTERPRSGLEIPTVGAQVWWPHAAHTAYATLPASRASPFPPLRIRAGFLRRSQSSASKRDGHRIRQPRALGSADLCRPRWSRVTPGCRRTWASTRSRRRDPCCARTRGKPDAPDTCRTGQVLLRQPLEDSEFVILLNLLQQCTAV